MAGKASTSQKVNAEDISSSLDMASIITNSTTPTEFLFFPKLPAELRQLVWDEVLVTTLDIQRFNAEIAPRPGSHHGNSLSKLMLCLTPDDDFVQLTKGYVGLLGACCESRAAAVHKIEGYLPIQYIGRDREGPLIVRSARVPYNPDGQVCISGLGPAFRLASEGLRSSSLRRDHRDHSDVIAENIRCVTIPEIKNLAIALHPPRKYDGSCPIMFGWVFNAFNNLVTRMAEHKLETVELVDSGWLGERHDNNHPVPFEWLHMPTPIMRSAAGAWCPRFQIPWATALENFRANIQVFTAVKKIRESAVGQ